MQLDWNAGDLPGRENSGFAVAFGLFVIVAVVAFLMPFVVFMPKLAAAKRPGPSISMRSAMMAPPSGRRPGVKRTLRLEAELRARVGNIGMGSSSPASSCNAALGSLGGDDQLAIEPAAIVLAAAVLDRSRASWPGAGDRRRSTAGRAFIFAE